MRKLPTQKRVGELGAIKMKMYTLFQVSRIHDTMRKELGVGDENGHPITLSLVSG